MKIRLLIMLAVLLIAGNSWATTFVSDTFTTGAESASLESRTGETGATWARHPNYSTYAQYVNFKRSWGAGLYYASGTPPTADYSVEADIYVKEAVHDIGLAVRLSPTVTTAYFVKYIAASGYWRITRTVAGTSTNYATTYSQSLALWSNYHLKVTVETIDASTVQIKAYVDGVLRLTWDDTGATRILDANNVGISQGGFSSYVTGVHVDNFEAKGLADADAINLYDYTDKTVVQRAGTSGTITIRGTYNGAPAGIEARLVEHGTSTEVVTWTALSSPAFGAGYFSGTITAPQGGWYNVQVRFASDTGVTATSTKKVGVGVIIGLAGQSNIANWLLYTDVTPDDHISVYAPATNSWATAYGNGASSAGNLIYSVLGVPVGFLQSAVTGTAIAQWTPTATTSYAYKLYHMFHETGNAVSGVIWSQGEYEAKYDTGDAEGNYFANLATLFTNFRNVMGADTKIYISLIPTGTATDYPYVQGIRNAQIRRCADANTYFSTMTDLIKTDIHFTAASYTTNGRRMAQAVLYQAGSAAYYQGPSVTYTKVDASNIKINITHVAGTDITPASGYTGWVVNDNGTPVTISTITKTSATELNIALAAPLAGTETVSYLAGQFPTITGAVVDNATIPMSVVATVNGLVANNSPAQPSTHRRSELGFGMGLDIGLFQ